MCILSIVDIHRQYRLDDDCDKPAPTCHIHPEGTIHTHPSTSVGIKQGGSDGMLRVKGYEL